MGTGTSADDGAEPVSYTHLDVYKRQTLACAGGIGATSALAAPAATTAWVIAVDGQILGAADQEAALQALYELSLIHISV